MNNSENSSVNRFGTRLIHNGNEIDKNTGALSIPIYQVSTYHQKDVDVKQEFSYSRSGNPTRFALEESIASLEGVAAVSSVLSMFSAGDHIIMCRDVYGGSYRASTTIFKRFNLEVEFVDTTDPKAVENRVRENTRAIYIETPSNPTMKITDIREMVRIAKEHGLLTVIDNTFMSPYLQRPIELGVDIVIHSATKFIGGHSDVIGGLVVAADEELSKKIYAVQIGYGAILGPLDSWLLLITSKTVRKSLPNGWPQKKRSKRYSTRVFQIIQGGTYIIHRLTERARFFPLRPMI